MKLNKLAVLALFATVGVAQAQTTLLSTQMRPVEEADKMRNVILKGAPDAVNFIPEFGDSFFTRMKAELSGSQGKVSATMALDGELAPVDQIGGLSDLDGLAKKLSATREFNAAAMAQGKLGGKNQRFIPVMTNTYQMVANKKAWPTCLRAPSWTHSPIPSCVTGPKP